MNSTSSAALCVLAVIFLTGSAVPAASPWRLNDPLPAGGEIHEYWITPAAGRVVYLADQTTKDVWELFSVRAAGGTPLRLNGKLGAAGDVNFQNIKISPDGSRVVFFADAVTDGVFDAYIVAVTGGTPMKVEGLTVSSYFEFSPDSSRILFFGAAVFPDETSFGIVELYNVPVTAGERLSIPVVLAPETGVSDFHISPDGKRVAYRVYHADVGASELYSMDLLGTQPVKLNGDPFAGESVQQGYQFSPDSSRIVHQVYRTAEAVWDLYSVPAAGGFPARLNDPFTGPGGLASNAQFSPDGSRVIFSAGRETGTGEIYSAPIGGGNPLKLNGALVSGGSARIQGITPDGHVIYTAGQIDLGPGLYSVSATGGLPVKLTAPLPGTGQASYVQSTPDGSRVVFRTGDEESEVWELFSVSISGEAAVKLNGDLAAGGTVFDARISPDGNRVVYRIDYQNEQRWELFSVLTAGGNPVKLDEALTDAASDDANLSFKITPDSSRVVYYADRSSRGIYELYSVPITGVLPDFYAAFALASNLTTPASGDEDADEIPNLLEYALGLNPNAKNQGGSDLPSLSVNGGNDTFRFVVPSHGGQDLRLDIESSTNLITWEVLATRNASGPWTGPVTLTPAGPGCEAVALTRATSGSRRSYRLAARLLP
jgi:Tol biopolymer transport system component